MKKLLTCVFLSALVGANADAITFNNPRGAKMSFILQASGSKDQTTVHFTRGERSINQEISQRFINHYKDQDLHIAVLLHAPGGHAQLCPQKIPLSLGFQSVNEKTVTYDPDDPKGFCTISK